MIATFGVGLALSGRARLAQRTRALLNHVGGRWMGDWLERHAPRFQRADDHLVSFFERERGALVVPMLLYATGWVVRGAETYLFLRLLGADVPFTTALVVETAIIVVRSVAVPVPAGLGRPGRRLRPVPEGARRPGRHHRGNRVRPAEAGKDLFWILVGFALVAFGRQGVNRAAP